VLQGAEQRRLHLGQRVRLAELEDRREEGALLGSGEEGLGGGEVTAADPGRGGNGRKRLEGSPDRPRTTDARKGHLHQRRHEARFLGEERHPPHRGESPDLRGGGGVDSRGLREPRGVAQLSGGPEQIQRGRDERARGEERLGLGLMPEAEPGADEVPVLQVELRLPPAGEQREPAGAPVLVRAKERLGRGGERGASHRIERG